MKPEPDEADKVFALFCTDGPLLLAFAGLAKVDASRTDVCTWVLETIRGTNRTIEQTIVHLTERLNRDRHRPWRGHHLAIAGAAFPGVGGGWYAPEVPKRHGQATLYQITNARMVAGKSVVENQFEAQKTVVQQPTFFLMGSGAGAIPREELARIGAVITRRPRRPEDFIGLLAKQVRTVAQRDKNNLLGVSAWSQGCYASADGEPFRWKSFRNYGDPPSKSDGISPQSFAGIDLAEIMRTFKSSIDAYWDGTITDEEFAQRTERGYRRSIDGRQ